MDGQGRADCADRKYGLHGVDHAACADRIDRVDHVDCVGRVEGKCRVDCTDGLARSLPAMTGLEL